MKSRAVAMTKEINRRHSRGCPSRDGGRCSCEAGYQAWVYLERERKKIYKTFARESEAKSWRSDALSAVSRWAAND